MRKFLLATVAVATLSACAAGRELSQQEASSYCARHSGGNAMTMNPFGEEYATWMAYCNDAWQARTVPSIAAAQGYIVEQQRQQIAREAIAAQNAASRRPLSCIQQGAYLNCY